MMFNSFFENDDLIQISVVAVIRDFLEAKKIFESKSKINPKYYEFYAFSFGTIQEFTQNPKHLFEGSMFKTSKDNNINKNKELMKILCPVIFLHTFCKDFKEKFPNDVKRIETIMENWFKVLNHLGIEQNPDGEIILTTPNKKIKRVFSIKNEKTIQILG